MAAAYRRPAIATIATPAILDTAPSLPLRGVAGYAAAMTDIQRLLSSGFATLPDLVTTSATGEQMAAMVRDTGAPKGIIHSHGMRWQL